MYNVKRLVGPLLIKGRWNIFLSVNKGQKISKSVYGMYPGFSQKQTKLTIILSKEYAQDSEFPLFFGRIQETINCFRDLMTFSKAFKIITR